MADFEEFTKAIRKRLYQGAKEYGSRSFERPPAELLSEIEEELLDVCGWSYILWARLRDIEARFSNIEKRLKT